MAKQNLAYSLESTKKKQVYFEKSELKLIKTDLQKRRKRALRVCVYLIAVFSMITVVYTHVAIAEVSYDINKANAYLKEAQSESTRLQASMDSTISRKNIEDKAGTLFGISKEDKSQVLYISLPKDNFAIINSENISFFTKIKIYILNFVEYISNIFNNN